MILHRTFRTAADTAEIFYSSAFRHTPLPMFLCDGTDKKIVDCTEAAAETLGTSPYSMIGKRLVELCSADENDPRHHMICESEDGVRFAVNTQLLPSGQTLATLQSLTEIHRQETAREDAERFRLVALATNDAVWEWDLRDSRVWWNASFEERFGYTAERKRSTMDFWLSSVPEGERTAIADGITRLLFNTDEEQWSMEHRFQRADGSYATVLDRAYVVRDEHGNPLTMIASMLDLSDRRAEEEERRRSERLSAMGALVAGVAHEVRNPLFAISAICDALEAEQGNRPEIAKYLTFLHSEIGRLTTLMRDLLEYGKPTPRHRVSAQIDDLMTVAVRRERQRLGPGAVRLVVESEQGLPPVRLDSTRIMQLFENLIQNAVQHSPAGGTVTLTARTCANGVECEVRDQGPGFPSDAMDRLFEPFFSKRRGGTGLGLAIAQRIVDDHGGTIEATTHERGGAVVTVRFPRATEDD
jgi:PAS domain S-box-containing protein